MAAKFPRGAPYYVSDFTYQELRSLDAGGWFADQLSLSSEDRQPFLRGLTDQERDEFIGADDLRLYASGAVYLPTLREALELARHANVMVDIELKTLPRMYLGLADAVVKLIVSMQMQSLVLISSFDHQQLSAVRTLSDEVALGVLTSDRIGKPGDYLRLLDADAYLPECCGDHDSMGFGSVSGELDQSSILHVSAASGHVIGWTCNEPDQIRRLIAAGVKGIISDYPNRVRRVLNDGDDRSEHRRTLSRSNTPGND